jgi:hypothetical protein
MVNVDVDKAADELYGLAPAEFTARRTALAAQAKGDGAAAAAKEISQLQRPTVSAGLINQLVRATGGANDGVGATVESDGEGVEHVGSIDRLLDLGTRLREAQAELDGARMRELTRERQHLVAELVRRVIALAAESDQKVSGAVQRELEETFGAAVADEQAALAVTSGRLTRALVYAGLGEVDVTAATATPLTRTPRRRPDAAPAVRDDSHSSSPPTDLGERRRAAEAAKLEAAATAVTETQAALALAEDELTAGASTLKTAQAEEAELSDRLDALQREIVQTRHELDAAGRSVTNADRDHRRAERAVQQARKAAQQAEQARDRLEPKA